MPEIPVNVMPNWVVLTFSPVIGRASRTGCHVLDGSSTAVYQLSRGAES